MFTFTPLSGAHSSSPASSSLLQFDNGIKILVDVGWDASFDHAPLEIIRTHTNSLSIILLTHATFEHIGAYAHCCKHIPGFSRIPTYATTPVVNLGRTLSADLYKSAPPAASLLPKNGLGGVGEETPETPDILLSTPTQDELAGYFSRIYPLKYSQPHQPIPSPFSPPLTGLTITAYGAGHTLGGTIWHLQYGMESIVYAADWNQTKENLFDGARLLESSGDEVIEPLQRPTAFVCSSRGVERTNLSSPKKRDETLISLIRTTIAQGGKVLIPTDSSARLLELAYVLNAAWRENMDGPHADTFKNTSIYMATRSSKATLRFLQSMLEWLEPGVAQEGETAMTTAKGNVHPLHWNHIKKIERKVQVDRALTRRRPGVILASDASLEWGFARDAIRSFAADSRNLLILTGSSSGWENGKSGLARQLWEFYASAEAASSAHNNVKIATPNGHAFTFQETTTTDLNADETSLYQQYMARQAQLHTSLLGDNALEPGTATVGEDQAEESSDSEDEDEDAEHQGRALNLSLQMTQNKRKVGLSDADLGVNVLLRGKNVYDYHVRNKRGREKMFPFVAHRNRSDEFGEVIKAEDYLRAEERDDGDGIDTSGASKAESAAITGQKRKWDDADNSKTKQSTGKSSKRTKVGKKPDENRAPDDIDAVIARATGASGEDGGTPGAAAPEQDSSSSEQEDDDESDYEPEDGGPKKMVSETVEIQFQISIAHVDFSGLAGLTDIVNIVSMMRPRKLIIAAGTEAETKLLAQSCQPIPEMGSAEILTPKAGDTVEASMDTNAWTLKLSPELIKRLEWQTTDSRGGEMRIASVAGLLAPLDPPKKAEDEANADDADEGGAAKKVKLEAGASSAAAAPSISPDTTEPSLPLLTVPPLVSTTSTTATAAHPVRVGELRLLDLRAHLTALGHEVAVRGLGTLLVDNSVVVRKIPATGRLEVECANNGFARARGRTMRMVGGGTAGTVRQVLDMRGVFFGVREEMEKALAVVR